MENKIDPEVKAYVDEVIEKARAKARADVVLHRYSFEIDFFAMVMMCLTVTAVAGSVAAAIQSRGVRK